MLYRKSLSLSYLSTEGQSRLHGFCLVRAIFDSYRPFISLIKSFPTLFICIGCQSNLLLLVANGTLANQRRWPLCQRLLQDHLVPPYWDERMLRYRFPTFSIQILPGFLSVQYITHTVLLFINTRCNFHNLCRWPLKVSACMCWNGLQQIISTYTTVASILTGKANTAGKLWYWWLPPTPGRQPQRPHDGQEYAGYHPISPTPGSMQLTAPPAWVTWLINTRQLRSTVLPTLYILPWRTCLLCLSLSLTTYYNASA
jgi:hypothetical protein